MGQGTTPNEYDFSARQYGIQGRWPSPDPAGLDAVDITDPQTWNRYACVRNSPLEMTDPLGDHACYLGSNQYDMEVDQKRRDKEGGVWVPNGDGMALGNDCYYFPDSYDTSCWNFPSDTLGDTGGPLIGGAGGGRGREYEESAAEGSNRCAGPIRYRVYNNLRWAVPEVCGAGYFALRGAEGDAVIAHGGAYVIANHDSRSGNSIGYLFEGGPGPISVGYERSLNLDTWNTDSAYYAFAGIGDHLGGFASYTGQNSPIELGGYASAFGRGVGAHIDLVPGGACHN